MILEVILQSSDMTAAYTLYVSLLISVSLSVLLVIQTSSSLTESSLLKIYSKPSEAEAAYKNTSELGMKLQLLILKRIKIKIDPGEDANSFFSNSKNSKLQEEKNEKAFIATAFVTNYNTVDWMSAIK